tara:strand:+ start:3113 stop:3523 length:411 start_codon:yes stop_codon:yes gene_type:complete
MNFYETMYVVHPALQAGRLDDMIQIVDKKVKELKGKSLYCENWGKKKLAYQIDKQKYGTYVLIQFSLSGDMINELKNEFEHNSNILRYLINRIDEDAILEQKEMPIEEATSKKNEETNKENDVEKENSKNKEEDSE